MNSATCDEVPNNRHKPRFRPPDMEETEPESVDGVSVDGVSPD
jgi:hypothetical protein